MAEGAECIGILCVGGYIVKVGVGNGPMCFMGWGGVCTCVFACLVHACMLVRCACVWCACGPPDQRRHMWSWSVGRRIQHGLSTQKTNRYVHTCTAHTHSHLTRAQHLGTQANHITNHTPTMPKPTSQQVVAGPNTGNFPSHMEME